MSDWDIAGKRVLITGANSGIGLETAVELARRGARVVITARDHARGTAARDEIRARSGAEVALVDLDLASLASVRDCAKAVQAGGDALHVLINNAGVCLSPRRVTVDGFETTFQVNHLGHFLLTNLLLDRLRQSAPSRIVTVASKAYSLAGRTGLDFDDLQSERQYHGLTVYGRSKLMNIYFTRVLARRLEDSHVTANCLHPGMVATRFARDGDMSGIDGLLTKLILSFGLRPAQGARSSIHLATAADLQEVSGGFFQGCRQSGLRAVARDEAAAGKLWQVSEALVDKFLATSNGAQ